jgi:hypothetical protein
VGVRQPGDSLVKTACLTTLEKLVVSHNKQISKRKQFTKILVSTSRNQGYRYFLSQIKYTVESHSISLEPVKYRTSGLGDRIDNKERTEELLDKRPRALKGICKNSVTPSKDQIHKSRALKKNRYEQKV